MATMIEVDDLGKRYRLGGMDKYYSTLREHVMRAVLRPLRRRAAATEEHVWALRHVNLEVAEGEVLGIIGRNGAGKTTLLKVLSRVTRPTEGGARLYGRVGSLLEVGTGFHPELTGRENVYLSGSILGMAGAEVRKKFDEIVAFAEIAKFLDTPVKHYSSGMYVRLAFSVAAHLEPEILLVDEVLAVGDLGFQQKCLGKMEGAARGGRTVLFVSHNMGAVRSLCTRAVCVDGGRIVEDGDVAGAIGAYERMLFGQADQADSVVERDAAQVAQPGFYVRRVAMTDSQGHRRTAFRHDETLHLVIDLHGAPPTRAYNLEFRLHNGLGQFVGMGSSAYHGMLLTEDTRRLGIRIGPLALTAGEYCISLSTVDSIAPTRYDEWKRCCGFRITECSPFGQGQPLRTGPEGMCVLPQAFEHLA